MRHFLYLSFLFLSITVNAQRSNYPQNYFRNPLNIPILLAGNFGECRPGHFHSGIDIKTKGKENLPVYAAADGYISRIKLEPGGFGHAVYITHPNGYTTLYAHLNNFFPTLQKRVHQKQYAQEKWELDLAFKPNEYPVKQGQQIAWSGNTGGSTAPHLHFEIRDTKTEHPLNPLLFGIKIADNIAPLPSQLALYDMNNSIYEQMPVILTLKKAGSIFVPTKDSVLVSTNKMGLGIYVNDFMNGSENTLSFYTAQWYVDDVLQGSLMLDDIGYDETRYLNACADYKTKQQKGIWFNSLFVLPNNRLDRIYQSLNDNKGVISLPDDNAHQVRIELTDANENKSIVSFVVAQKGNQVNTNCANLFNARKENSLEHTNVRFNIDNSTLYDNICFRFDQEYDAQSLSARYKIHYAYVPVHKYFELNIKPDKAIPFSMTGKIAMICNDGQHENGRSTKLIDGWYRSSVRSFGTYRLVLDTIAPTIKPLVKNGIVLGSKKELRFVVTDNYTSVKTLKGSINGHWLCFEQHENNWFYRIDEYCPKGKNKLALVATDENGNERTMDYYFTR